MKVIFEQMLFIDIFFYWVVVDFIGLIQLVINCDNCYILILEDFLFGIQKFLYLIQRVLEVFIIFILLNWGFRINDDGLRYLIQVKIDGRNKLMLILVVDDFDV